MKPLFASIATTIPALIILIAYFFYDASSSVGDGVGAAAAIAAVMMLGFLAYTAVLGFVAFPLIWFLSKRSSRVFVAINFGLAFLVCQKLYGLLHFSELAESWSEWLAIMALIGLPQLLLMAVWWWLVTQYKPSNKRLRSPIETPPRLHESVQPTRPSLDWFFMAVLLFSAIKKSIFLASLYFNYALAGYVLLELATAFLLFQRNRMLVIATSLILLVAGINFHFGWRDDMASLMRSPQLTLGVLEHIAFTVILPVWLFFYSLRLYKKGALH